MIDKIGGRKFVGFIVISILFTLLVIVGKIQVEQFITFVTANFGIYVVGNSAEHLSENI